MTYDSALMQNTRGSSYVMGVLLTLTTQFSPHEAKQQIDMLHLLAYRSHSGLACVRVSRRMLSLLVRPVLFRYLSGLTEGTQKEPRSR